MKPDKKRAIAVKPDKKHTTSKQMARIPTKRAPTPSPPAAVALQAEIVLEASRLGLVPLTQGGSAAILEIVDNLTPSAYDAMHRLSQVDPDAFLKHYLAMAEFKMPKLARTELKVEGEVNMAHFVAVEKREERPPAKVIDARVVV